MQAFVATAKGYVQVYMPWDGTTSTGEATNSSDNAPRPHGLCALAHHLSRRTRDRCAYKLETLYEWILRKTLLGKTKPEQQQHNPREQVQEEGKRTAQAELVELDLRAFRLLGHTLIPLVMFSWAFQLGFTRHNPFDDGGTTTAPANLAQLYFLEHVRSLQKLTSSSSSASANCVTEEATAERLAFQEIDEAYQRSMAAHSDHDSDLPLLPHESMPLGSEPWTKRLSRIRRGRLRRERELEQCIQMMIPHQCVVVASTS